MMPFWEKLFGGSAPKAPSLSDERFALFLEGWAAELRSNEYTGQEILDEGPERFFEHFPDTFDKQTENKLVTELHEWIGRFLNDETAAEETWAGATSNDRLSAAFDFLNSNNILALEDAGVTIQDGWAGVGLQQQQAHRGAVFFHQQDIIDLMRGEELLLAFGAFEEQPDPMTNEEVGVAVMTALASHGLKTSWSGEGRHRIRVPGFKWQKRRVTPHGDVTGIAAAPTGHASFDAKDLAVPERLNAENVMTFAKPVTAVRSSKGFNVGVTNSFEALWREHGGVRGQVCHLGLPHNFVPAGQQTELGVCNAYLNLDDAAATALRIRGRREDRIEQERQSTVRAAPWPRSLWSSSGTRAQVGLIVVSSAPLNEVTKGCSPVDYTAWSPYSIPPDGFDLRYSDRTTEAERFASLEKTARGIRAQVPDELSEAACRLVESARHGAVIQCHLDDPQNLAHLQFAWAVARWLLSRADGIVFDINCGRWWTREQLVSWEAGGWPTGRKFLLSREVRFGTSNDGPNMFIESMGLRKFARPDLILRQPIVDESVPAWGAVALEEFVTKLALGALFAIGQELKFGSELVIVERCEPGVNAPSGADPEALVLRAP